MSSPNPIPDERAVKEAAAWFSRLNTRSVSSETLEGFRLWRQGAGNREAYAEVERAWRRSTALEGGAETDAAVADALARGRSRRTEATARRWRSAAMLGLTLALAATLGLGVAWQAGAFGERYGAGVGEQRLIQLADGSRIRLDTNTQLVVHLSAHLRRIELKQGQALFEVAHDASRPFVVEAGAAKVRALGTQFDVRRDATHVQVTLLEGRVEVRPGRQPDNQVVVLRPGEQVVADGGLGAPRSIDTAATTSWTDGRLLFHAIPLRQAIAEMNRYSRRQIVLEAPGLAEESVSGAFDTGNIDGFVSAVGDLHGLRAETDDTEIRLVPGKS
ncbi:FecR domain-containing protein [Phenylobacterium sp.]|uniref:FecR family protein n=1 Tax=Phenylobacterium sp. TaxID=1871053 RepID=UPI0035B09C07